METITTADRAAELLAELAETHDWVSVFWDRRGRSVPEISIIVDGNGQQPKAMITADVYRELCDTVTVGKDKLQTFHPRRLHDYKAPPAEDNGPNPADAAEKVVRAIIAAHPDWPLEGEFFRGFGDGKRPQIQREYVETATASRLWVRLAPHGDEVAVLAMRFDFLGSEMDGPYRAVEYPTADGEVDFEALAGPEFRADVIAAIKQRLDEIGWDKLVPEQARTKPIGRK